MYLKLRKSNRLAGCICMLVMKALSMVCGNLSLALNTNIEWMHQPLLWYETLKLILYRAMECRGLYCTVHESFGGRLVAVVHK